MFNFSYSAALLNMVQLLSRWLDIPVSPIILTKYRLVIALPQLICPPSRGERSTIDKRLQNYDMAQ